MNVKQRTVNRVDSADLFYLPDGLVEGGAEELAAVFTETDAGYSFTVGAFEPPQTLAALDLPHLCTQKHTAASQSGRDDKHRKLVPLYVYLYWDSITDSKTKLYFHA